MKGIKWKRGVRRVSSVLWRYFTVTCYNRYYHKKALGINFRFTDVKIIDHQTYFREDEYKMLRKILLGKVSNNMDYFDEYRNKCYASCDEHIKNCTRISGLDFSKKPNIQLLTAFRSYIETRCTAAIFLNSIHIMADILSDKIKEKLGRNYSDVLMSKLIAPSKLTNSIKKEIDLLNIAIYVQEQELKNFKEDNKAMKIICSHAEKYGWLNINQFYGNPLNESDIISEIKGLLEYDCSKKLKELMAGREKRIKDSSQKAIEMKAEGIVKTASEYMYLELYRIEALNYSDFLIGNLLREIASRMGISYNELTYLSHDEVIAYLKNGTGPIKTGVKERIKGYAIIGKGNTAIIYTSRKLSELLKSVKEFHKYIKEITGNVANVGKAKGKVRIIMETKDIQKVKLGDIIVSPMTHSSLVPALRKASAIVTDEGGLGCHAAIISRELGIPCIVGTRISTSVLKDGYIVEVDAEKGTVRIIEP
ncbi:hypothetical protein J4401_06895 [Candidatus Woesearchaeota archaeon]|nr:hypothetical protein [Candidatus Woesearchaeota archaeon]